MTSDSALECSCSSCLMSCFYMTSNSALECSCSSCLMSCSYMTSDSALECSCSSCLMSCFYMTSDSALECSCSSLLMSCSYMTSDSALECSCSSCLMSCSYMTSDSVLSSIDCSCSSLKLLMSCFTSTERIPSRGSMNPLWIHLGIVRRACWKPSFCRMKSTPTGSIFFPPHEINLQRNKVTIIITTLNKNINAFENKCYRKFYMHHGLNTEQTNP